MPVSVFAEIIGGGEVVSIRPFFCGSTGDKNFRVPDEFFFFLVVFAIVLYEITQVAVFREL
jgi:hypothetical protein